MHQDDAARFRKQAEEARQQAAKAISPLDKETWLRVAEEWLKLALSTESRCLEVRPPQLATLRVYLNVAIPTVEGATVLTINQFKTAWEGSNGRRLLALTLKQAGHSSLAALRAMQLFIPFIHGATLDVENARRVCLS